MANALFAKARQKFLAPGTLGTTSGDAIDWADDNIKVVAVDHAIDTPDPATDEFLSDIAAGARIATSGNLASKTVTDGIADAADFAFTAVSGASIESLVIYKDTGTEGTSSLIAFIDTATGLPFTPSGGDINVTWPSGTNRIFKL